MIEVTFHYSSFEAYNAFKISDHIAWLSDHGIFWEPDIVSPAAGKVRWVGSNFRIKDRAQESFIFHEDDRQVALLFKLTWCGK